MRLHSLLATAGLIILGGCSGLHGYGKSHAPRTIRADVVAIDQPITYNRFGSFNPYGMIYALSNDVELAEAHRIGKSNCPAIYRLKLKDDVRPRPLVLRGNQGDRLQVRFTNNLLPNDPGFWGATGQPNISKCRWHDVVPAAMPKPAPDDVRYDPYPNDDYSIDHGNHRPEDRREAIRKDFVEETGREPTEEETEAAIEALDSTNWPATRTASFVVSGMTALRGATCYDYDSRPNDADIWLDASDPRVTGIKPIQAGECFVYEYVLGKPGTHLFFSLGAPSGGQGDGGSLTHGLFGSVNVQPKGSRYYRSQVTADAMDMAMDQATGSALIDFEAKDDDGTPLLNMIKRVHGKRGLYDLVHGDLNAMIVDCDGRNKKKKRCKDIDGNRLQPAFREFTVIFHDELKTFYPEPIKELGTEYQLEGVGDGFAINYGASGMGSILLANRKGFGPAKDCLECLYEEFFLQSWANGDPALLVNYEDDPANVHHSYLGDRVEFRNLHAGPKETHVFHLHAHQWLAQQDEPGSAESYGTYLDSQTIAPQQGFAYNIYYGGSGNRNQTAGDSIFHCHLYPHFAQGMWALWRVHDVFEDGTRYLPDGQAGPGTDPYTGDTDGGTPIPAVVPLPKQAMPPLPTYGENGMPGYPFYIPGLAGHRAPQPPLDFARDGDTEPWQDGGLPRHVFTGKGERVFGELTLSDQQNMTPDELVTYALRTGDFSAHLDSAEIDLLDHEGEPIEKAAMKFHAGDAEGMTLVDGSYRSKPDTDTKPGYDSITPEGKPERLLVNNAEPQPGAPFADPCRADYDDDGNEIEDTGPERTVRYDVSAIELDLIVNKAGWHDPQARINVLSKDAKELEGKTTGDAEPFFFRANSRDCIEFRHTNRIKKDLKLDDFQVKTPTDTIGQHIHLVKFDVTSSDGSGNGFNYEDGTLAHDEVHGRIIAAKDFTDAHGTGDGDQLDDPVEGETYQTTVQRWYADPLLSGRAREDRTIRTVFTHDHFAPSSIQHHGFYSALLVEPKDSTWYTAGGELMCPEIVDGVPCTDRPGVGSEAIIKVAEETDLHRHHREFAMAIADFGLLYAPHQGGVDDEAKGLGNLVGALEGAPVAGVDPAESDRLIDIAIKRRNDIRQAHGVPVDPPLLPEAISKNHHNPYLVNYRNEPLPLRVGDDDPDPEKSCEDHIVDRIKDGGEEELDSLRRGRGHVGDGVVIDPGDHSIKVQGDDEDKDMSRVFSSAVHGDPCTPTVEGYVGETVQLRMIQGAQEVQHMFEAQGLNWRREIANPESPRVAAQEIGISEHFEMELPTLTASATKTLHQDYLYRFSTVDDLWNGAWGLLRSFADAKSAEAGFQDGQAGDRLASVAAAVEAAPATSLALPDSYTVEVAETPSVCPADANVRLHVVDAVTVKDVIGKPLLYNEDHSIADWDALAFVPIYSTTFETEKNLGLLQDRTVRGVGIQNAGAGTTLGLSETADKVDREGGFGYSPHLAATITQERADRYQELRLAETLEPMVLRARAGECIVIRLRNLLLHTLKNGTIVEASNDDGTPRSKVDDNDCVSSQDDLSCAGEGNDHLHDEEGYDPRHLPRIVKLNAIQLRASELVGLTPQQVHVNVGKNGGIDVGWNDEEGPETQAARPGEAVTYVWYAGEMRTTQVGMAPSGAHVLQPEWEPKALGPINLSSLVDPIEHGQQGLIGALIVEEADAVAYDPESRKPLIDLPNGTSAYIDPDGKGKTRPFHEFVLLYQDGLNLRWQNETLTDGRVEAVPDCLICDDSYDRGEKGTNYRTEPFWARLNQHPTTDLNSRQFPPEFFLDDWKSVATPGYKVIEGEAVTFHVLQPYGRARQRAFMVLGHDYLDLLPHFGSRHSALISVGKAVKAELSTTETPDSHKAAKGDWIWRDGPAQHFSSGVWGTFEVEAR